MTRAWLLVLALAVSASAQLKEKPDVYEFGPPYQHTPRYEHDKKRSKIILNPDFWCSQCAKEGRIKYKTRDEMADILETHKVFPHPMDDGTKERHYGKFRLMEHDADQVLDFLMGKKRRDKKKIFIEDKFFRLYTDLGSFHTKKPIYPRREAELAELADVFPDVSDKTITLNSHHRAHLYLIRAHRVLRDFTGLIEHKEKDSDFTYLGPYLGTRQKWEIYLFSKQKDVGAFLGKFLGQEPDDGICWHTLKDDSMVVATHADKRKDVHLNNTFTHRLSYNMITAWKGYQYDIPQWLGLGYAHLMERRERTDFDTFIFGEGKVPKLIEREKWKVWIRRNIDKDTFRPFQQVADLDRPNQIPVDEHFMSWSLVGYMFQRDQKKAGQFIRLFKSRKKGESIRNLTIRAFRTVWKTSIAQFADDWKAWVKATYPTN